MDQAAISHFASGLQLRTTEALDFEAIVALYRPKVFRFALASLRDRDAAETVTQDCFLKAHQSLARFRGDCSLSTWLMQIAVNLVRDHVRNRRIQFWRKLQASTDEEEALAKWIPDRDTSPEQKAALRQQVAAVWETARILPDRQRTVFLLRFVEDMDLLEIASVTGMKEGTVKTHLFRALNAVRARMGVTL